jgi:hypothetical protein
MKKFLILTTVLLLLAACAAAEEPADTPTPEPTNTPVPPTPTPEPTLTPTLEPTATPEPTNTPTSTPEPTLAMGDPQEVLEGGFSFQPVEGQSVEMNGPAVFLVDADPEGSTFISFFGEKNYRGVETQQEIIDAFLAEFAEAGSGSFEKSEPYVIIIDGNESTAFDITGSFSDVPIEGQTVLVMPSESQFLYGLSFSFINNDETKWEEEGKKAFSALISSIKFIKEVGSGESFCKVSTDDSYGYSIDNPIKVGTDCIDIFACSMEGPSRERAYLDSLSGPNGEIVRYERLGSLEHGDTILDKYTVLYSGTTVTLYLDMYAYEEPMAPADFKCWTAISLPAP